MRNQSNRSYYSNHSIPYRLQPASGLAITSLVLGILAFLSGWFFMGVMFGSAAIVFGIASIKRSGSSGIALAGIIGGGIGALAGAIFTTIWIVALMQAGTIPSSINKLSNNLAAQNKIVQAQIAAKKDFEKGETARFGSFDVKINSIKRNFVPDNSSVRAGEGKELILINLSVKNNGPAKPFTSYGLKFGKDGVVSGLPAISPAPVFYGESIAQNGTASGTMVFEIPKNASDLKLLYQEIVYDLEHSATRTLTYSLAI